MISDIAVAGPALRQPVPHRYGQAVLRLQGVAAARNGANFSPQAQEIVIFVFTRGPSRPRALQPEPVRSPKTLMNAHSDAPVEMNTEEVLQLKLAVLRREHRDLDEAIAALVDTGHPDQLRIVRLKKQKLSLKDQIARIEDRLTPDIIA
ncbi:hypothetical protein SDC9_16920 [bioreactor metagenome]